VTASTRPLRIGTRGSDLALFQARAVAALLEARGVACELVPITTSGERFAEAALSELGGKNVFVKEIEEALAAGHVDLAVHSSKDLPAVLPAGFALAAVLAREDPRDALVLPTGASPLASLAELAARLGRAPRLGTSSVRRAAQIVRLLPGAECLPVRGHVGTRLRKLDEGRFDALVLAAAGLRRLGHEARIALPLPPEACVPAPGQGLIAVEVRAGDAATRDCVAALDDAAGAAALAAERAVVERLGGGCQMPIGAYAALDGDRLTLTAVVLSLDGAREVRTTARGHCTAARDAGTAAAGDLLAAGAGEILAALASQRTDGGTP
jgi:hydroxymethylbilane synthase